MAVRFYKELNNLSTADFIAYKATPRRGKLYEIERVIAKKMRKGKAVYLIKWAGYHSFSRARMQSEFTGLENMGTASENKNHTLLEKEDFVRCAFPKDWDILIDKLGDGVKVAIPY
ncbi:Hypothetical predicted protein [Paramuricea clavata]|uniref:Uncharacterized protein n=1 Tax=Paramuricea clavata TaxID=317549 RepID=A0A7D9DRF0_PARCT|nr:Hypothetical predicted protein [Paramuricea clavata]